MSSYELPSVESLVNRIKNRIKYPQLSQKHQIQKYRSPVKQLQDEQIGHIPVLDWDQNNPYRANEHHNGFYRTNNFQQLTNHNHTDTQTVRNLKYSEQMNGIPRVPHRKHQGDTMKTLIYDAHYAKQSLNPPVPVNYDHQYTEYQKKYYKIQTGLSDFYRHKSKSVIRRNLQKDKLSGKKYPKFMN